MGISIVRRDVQALLMAVAASSLLGGCGFIDRHFHKQNTEYQRSVEERPLDVPPDLDRPNTTGALVIPPAGGAAAAPATSSAAPAAPAAASEAPAGMSTAPATAPSAPAAGAVTLSGNSLQVADSVSSTWHRVGLAIERSGAGTIVARDEAGYSYDVQTTGQTTTKPGWFKRMITLGRAKTKVTAQVQLKVRVTATGGGSQVSIEGANDEASQDAARALLETLKQRLT